MSRGPPARAAVAAGAVLLAFAVVVALPVFGPTAASLLVAFVGGALVIVGSVTAPADASMIRSIRRSWKWSIPVAIGVVGVVVSRFAAWRVDVTSAGTNTLADESRAVAGGLSVPVRVVAFLDEGSRARTELAALVDRYVVDAPRLTLALRSPRDAEHLEEARALGLAELLTLGGPNVAVIAERPSATPVRLRFDAGMPDAEEVLTNALARASSSSQVARRVYVVAGHGEPDLNDDSATGLTRLRQALLPRDVELAPLPLSALGGRIPNDAKALMVLPSSAPWLEDEERAVRAFVDGGGALFVLLEPDRPAPLASSLCARVGVDVLPDVVVDESPFTTLLGGADVVTGSSQQAHAITRPLRGALTHFPRATGLGLSPVDGASVVPVVSTGSEARLPKLNAQGPLPLVVAAEFGAGSSRQRIVIAADASFVQNVGLGLGANRDLALNAVLWLVEDDARITVRPRVRGGSLVFLTPGGREALAFVLLVIVPATLAAAGAALHAVRRAR